MTISANKFTFSPCGPACVACAARDAGHEVAVFDCLFSDNPASELIPFLKAMEEGFK